VTICHGFITSTGSESAAVPVIATEDVLCIKPQLRVLSDGQIDGNTGIKPGVQAM